MWILCVAQFKKEKHKGDKFTGSLLQAVFLHIGVFFFFISSLQEGQRHVVRSTETASWARRGSARGDRGLPLASTSPHVTRTVNINPCSVTAARDSAGAWTETDRRSPGLAPDLGAHRCVSNVFSAQTRRVGGLLN